MTVRLDELVDTERLDGMVESRLVSRRRHPKEPLFIYDYTARTTYSRTWTEETRLCRGLIVDGDGFVVSRPFAKFFTAAEHDIDPAIGPIPEGPPVAVSEKMDGSLGILYRGARGLAIATRGAFASAPARWATAHWHEHYDGLEPPDGVTWLFEIIYPDNRVVVDYRDFAGLVLLAAIDVVTGEDLALPADWPGPVVRSFASVDSIGAAKAVAAEEGREGVVVRFAGPPGRPSVRVKVKSDEYQRLHRLMTTVSPRTIWERLSTGHDLADVTSQVPAEFSAWVTGIAADLDGRYCAIERACRHVLDAVRCEAADRKVLAERVQRSGANPAVVFKMLDGLAYDRLIWRAIRPAGTAPFLVDVEG